MAGIVRFSSSDMVLELAVMLCGLPSFTVGLFFGLIYEYLTSSTAGDAVGSHRMKEQKRKRIKLSTSLAAQHLSTLS